LPTHSGYPRSGDRVNQNARLARQTKAQTRPHRHTRPAKRAQTAWERSPYYTDNRGQAVPVNHLPLPVSHTPKTASIRRTEPSPPIQLIIGTGTEQEPRAHGHRHHRSSGRVAVEGGARRPTNTLSKADRPRPTPPSGTVLIQLQLTSRQPGGVASINPMNGLRASLRPVHPRPPKRGGPSHK